MAIPEWRALANVPDGELLKQAAQAENNPFLALKEGVEGFRTFQKGRGDQIKDRNLAEALLAFEQGGNAAPQFDEVISGYRTAAPSPQGQAGAVVPPVEDALRGPVRSAAGGYRRGEPSGQFESSGDYTAINLNDSKGTASYGRNQINSQNMGEFAAKYAPGVFDGLAPKSAEFNKRWKEWGNTEEGKAAQHKYIEDTHFVPMVDNLRKTTGLDVTARSPALEELAYSTAVQFGPNSDVIAKAIKGRPIESLSDAEIVDAVTQYKIDNVDSLFKSTPANQRPGLQKRWAREREVLQGLVGAPRDASTAGAQASYGAPGQSGFGGVSRFVTGSREIPGEHRGFMSSDAFKMALQKTAQEGGNVDMLMEQAKTIDEQLRAESTTGDDFRNNAVTRDYQRSGTGYNEANTARVNAEVPWIAPQAQADIDKARSGIATDAAAIRRSDAGLEVDKKILEKQILEQGEKKAASDFANTYAKNKNEYVAENLEKRLADMRAKDPLAPVDEGAASVMLGEEFDLGPGGKLFDTASETLSTGALEQTDLYKNRRAAEAAALEAAINRDKLAAEALKEEMRLAGNPVKLVSRDARGNTVVVPKDQQTAVRGKNKPNTVKEMIKADSEMGKTFKGDKYTEDLDILTNLLTGVAQNNNVDVGALLPIARDYVKSGGLFSFGSRLKSQDELRKFLNAQAKQMQDEANVNAESLLDSFIPSTDR